jgi:hypothetical protein
MGLLDETHMVFHGEPAVVFQPAAAAKSEIAFQ